MNIKLSPLLLILVAAFGVSAQVPSTDQVISAGQQVEREITGGQEQKYKFSLSANQLVRLRLDQNVLDAALVVNAPDGRQLADLNLTGTGESEWLTLDTAPGVYGVTVRGSGTLKMAGSYRLEFTILPTPSESDRKYLTAQNLLIESVDLAKKAPTSPQLIEKLEQSLALWRTLNEPLWAGLALREIGKAYVSLNRYDKAMDFQEQAIAISRESKNRLREGSYLYDLGLSYFNQQQYEKAVGYFRQCIAILRETKQRRREGVMIYALGNTQMRLNQQAGAIASFEQALLILRETNDRAVEGQAMISLGLVYSNQGRQDKAREIGESAIAVFQEIKDHAGEGQVRINLSTVYSRLGETEKAIKTLEPALAILRQSKNKSREASVLNALGLAYGGVGEFEKSNELFDQSLAIARELKDKRLEAIALTNLGMGYSFLSRFEKSIEHLQLALPIALEIKDRASEAGTHSGVGVVYVKSGQFEKAIESHEKSLEIYREIKNRAYEGNELQNLGNVYKLLGRDDKAIEYYDQALAVFREVKYRVGEGDVLNNLGDVYIRLNRDDEAVRVQEQALAIFREVKYRLGEGTARLTLGAVHDKLRKYEKALEVYEQALAIFREVKSPEYEGLTLFRMGETKVQLDRTDEAAAHFTESVAISRLTGSKRSEFGALTALAKLQRNGGDVNKAKSTVEESLKIAESLRADLISPESRTSFFLGVQDSYELYTDLLMRQHSSEPGKGFDRLAVEVAERQRSRSLLDLLTESNTNVRKGVDAVLIEQERALAKKLSDKAQALQRADKPERANVLRGEIGQLDIELERTQSAIRKGNPNYAALVQPQPLKFKEIQAQLDPDTLLLQYALGSERSHLWAITNNSITAYELPKEEIIKERALQVYEMLTARNTRKSGETDSQRKARVADAEAGLPASAFSLSQTILGPAAAQLGSKRLVIVADGALQYIPFAMLPDPVAGRNQPLIVGHEVVSLPSSSALAIQRRELAARPAAPKMLAVIADPVFDRTDARFKTASAETGTDAQAASSADTRGLEHIADTSGGKTGRLIIRRLPFTRQEADGLMALTPKESSFRAIDFQASRPNILGSDLSQYRYVHFATHGLLDTERPGLSSLVLSTVDADGKPQDGFLRANDIYNMKLPAELVVLSACQTGLGKEVKGEGLIGLTRGFMYAGAKRVVVSLWSVNDKATSDLMTKFYRGMLKDNERPAAALRAAQIEMWKQKKWQSPYYWAAFTMQGEWQ